MSLPAPFRHEGEHLAIDLPGGRALFTTRRGGVSRGPYTSLNLGTFTGDERADVEVNRERLAELVGIPTERFAQGRQVHEATVRRRREPPDPAERRRSPADGQATDQTGVAPVVLVADCMPVALAGPEAVAMLHCGWRGLAEGIVAEGVAALRELGAGGSLTAAIVRDGRRLDLKLVARRRLEAAGVPEIHDVDLCTMCSDPGLFFSHRRDGGETGRQAGVVWRS